MMKKIIFTIALMSFGTIALAADNNWDGSAGDNEWNTGSNWSLNRVPNSSDNARIEMASGPVFSTGTTTAMRVLLRGTNGTLILDGGTLSTTSYFDIAYTASESGTLTVNSGTINISGTGVHFYCGRAGTATFNMNGGAVNVGGTFYVARDATSVTNVNLAGGTITCGIISMGLNGGNGTINISSTGKLIINGDATSTVNPYIANGWIKAYNGAGAVMMDYDTTTPGKTTLWADVPTKAGGPNPVNNATNVSIITDLSWTGVQGATAHEVYFGTASPGSFQASTTGTTFDVGRLTPNTTYFWKIDEVTGSGTVTGDVWTFTTGNVTAGNPAPANGAVNIAASGTTLSWSAGVSAASHNVYFGTTNPPAFLVNQTAASYNTGTLAQDTTYYWSVDEVEDAEHIYTGSVWSFSTQGSIKKGPYLIYPGNNTQMMVLWQMPNTAGCTISWGLDTTYSTGSANTTEYGTDHQHKYTITGLTPGTKYYYRVTAGPSNATGSFRTAPAADATTVKFLAYGDTRTYPADHSTVAAGMNSLIAVDPDYQTMLLHVGDWVNADAEDNWTNEFFNRSYPAQLQMEASLPIQGVMGNHEGNAVYYTKYWPYPYVSSRYWSYDYGPVHIILLDQYVNYTPGSAQYNWLVNDLSSSTKKWNIIVLHEPGWSAGGGHSNEVPVQQYIQPLCEQYGVPIIFGGHNHYYARAVVNGVHHVTTGAGGAPLYNPSSGENIIITSKTLEFCKVTIDGNSLVCEVVKPDGTVIDTFYAEKEEPDFTFAVVADPQIGWLYSGNNCGGQNVDYKWLETVNKLNVVNPEFAIVVGDLTDSKTNSSAIAYYKSCAAQLKPSISLYHLPGNHDVGDAPSASTYAIWQTNFSSSGTANPWFSFTYGNNLFICLDSMILKNSTNYPGKNTEEMNWLTTTLEAASGYDNIMVFMHIPLCMDAIDEVDGSNNMPLAVRNQLLNLFHTHGVKAVFSGHAHNNSYARDGALEIVTTSSCLCSLGSPATPQGFRVVKVYPNHIEHEYIANPDIVCVSGDFNCDGIIDFEDMATLTGSWLEGGLWP
ncbi:MAG: hypothetical protein A2Y10_18520 [Planctomycetes bacterium GWF2_41_51]|nr:MAG: hypothetical protein A2Y10_18520 [Planctomycetes bacterium GWF2_41_51]HBG28103.1 hypothetical protein [Phycisphaerales bacterium]